MYIEASKVLVVVITSLILIANLGKNILRFSEKLLSDGCQVSQVNIGLDDGLVASGNKPLSQPLYTHGDVGIWRH